MKDCIFCKIINKEIPSKVVYEDEELLAIHDVAPAAPIHILVIPKKHIESLATMKNGDYELISKIYKIIDKISEEQGFKQNGYRVIVNCGEDGCQEIKHLHFHILAGKKLGEKIVG